MNVDSSGDAASSTSVHRGGTPECRCWSEEKKTLFSRWSYDETTHKYTKIWRKSYFALFPVDGVMTPVFRANMTPFIHLSLGWMRGVMVALKVEWTCERVNDNPNGEVVEVFFFPSGVDMEVRVQALHGGSKKELREVLAGRFQSRAEACPSL